MNRHQGIIAAACAIFLLSIFSSADAQKREGLALTPPMGWNSWNKFGCDLNESLIRQTADAMAASGMRDAGYQYVVIDDCWQVERDSMGFIVADPVRFPSGIKALADYVHSKGLKFGIYSCAGSKTCGGRPGSRGHEYQDALTYAKWGVDYLKYDWCNTEGLSAVGAYTTMRDALYATGRPIVFSLCEWGNNKPWEWGGKVGQLWRTTGDISNVFDGEVNHGTWSSWGVMKIVEMREGIRQYAGPGHWNDPDMLEVGNGMSPNEDRSHFSLWCMMAAPLIAGNDLRNMSEEVHNTLCNHEVIAVDQDSLGIQGYRQSVTDSVEVWMKPLSHDEWAICFLNRSVKPNAIAYDWTTLASTDSVSQRIFNPGGTRYAIRDLWARKIRGTTATPVKATLQPHETLMLKLTPR
ncbi:MAG: glycoside hydrolase family 27 protein [Bacteroidota bacterium]